MCKFSTSSCDLPEKPVHMAFSPNQFESRVLKDNTAAVVHMSLSREFAKTTILIVKLLLHGIDNALFSCTNQNAQFPLYSCIPSPLTSGAVNFMCHVIGLAYLSMAI